MLLTMTFSQQKVQTLTRCHIMRSLIWVHTVCIMSHLDTLPLQQIVQAPIRRHMYKEWFRHKHKILSFFCVIYSVVVVIFQNYNLSKRFEKPYHQKRLACNKIILSYIYSTIYFLEKVIPEFQNV